VTRVTLRALAAGQVQDAVDHWLAQSARGPRAVVTEGSFTPLEVPDEVAVTRLAAGCVCCVGLIPLRVTLARLIRAGRSDLLLLLASGAHLPLVRSMLTDGSLGVKLQLEER
jgi:G3E family GTPase